MYIIPLVPTSGPDYIQVLRATSTLISVSWVPLTLEKACGFITGYTITAEPASMQMKKRQEGLVVVPVDHNTSRVVIDGLSPRLPYWVSVSGMTVAGTSTNNTRKLVELSGTVNCTSENVAANDVIFLQLQKWPVHASHAQYTHQHLLPCKELQR